MGQHLHELSLCFPMLIFSFGDVAFHVLQGRAGEMGPLDLRSSRVLIFSNISAGTGSVLRRCRPEGIWCAAAFRMVVRKIVSTSLDREDSESRCGFDE